MCVAIADPHRSRILNSRENSDLTFIMLTYRPIDFEKQQGKPLPVRTT
jgi:hypothetical protein